MQGRVKALIFDVDGTLAETEEIHRQAFNDTFAKLDLDWTWDRALYCELLRVTGGKERILHYLARYRPDEALLSEEWGRAIHALKTDRYTELLRGGAIASRPGVARLIDEAVSTGRQLAIATTTSRANVDALLHHAVPKIDAAAFEVIVAGDEVARKKPWPDVYHEALRRLEIPAAQCVAIEDSANGVLSACRAGIATLAIPSLYTIGDDFSGAFAAMSDLGEPHRGLVHLGGAGTSEGMVSIAALDRWLSTPTFLQHEQCSPGQY
jgi:HAD superfamily hydrolase (TIGR01509 family)